MRRKHDDLHHPMQGRGKRAPRGARTTEPRLVTDDLPVQCPGCGANQSNERGACHYCGTIYRSPATCPVCRMRFPDCGVDGYVPMHGDVSGDEPCDGVGELLVKGL